MNRTHTTIAAGLFGLAMLLSPYVVKADSFFHYGALSHHFNVPEDSTLDYQQTHPCLGYENSIGQFGWCEDSHRRNSWYAALNWQGRLGNMVGVGVGWQVQAGAVSTTFSTGSEDRKRKNRFVIAPGVTAEIGRWRGTLQLKPAFTNDEADVVFLRLSLPLK